jgi:hypothetical protein
MARKNPRRRRMAAQAKLLQGIMAEFGPAHDDSHKLQRGAVKNALNRPAALYCGNARPHTSEGIAPAWIKVGGRSKWQGNK